HGSAARRGRGRRAAARPPARRIFRPYRDPRRGCGDGAGRCLAGGRRLTMVPGEIIAKPGDIELNAGAPTVTLKVANTGDRPIQVGSHYHFYETNAGLRFDREKARGMRLDIAAGTAVRFEPGQTREVALVPLGGKREVYGFNQKIMGKL